MVKAVFFTLFPFLLFSQNETESTKIDQQGLREKTHIYQPGPIQLKLKNFINTINNDTEDVSIEMEDLNLFERFLNEEAFQKKFSAYLLDDIEEIITSERISINEDQEQIFKFFAPQLQWAKVDEHHGNLPLVGGFSFNYAVSMIKESVDYWKDSYEDFREYETPRPKDEELLSKLIYFETTTARGFYSPYTSYGCVYPNDKTFPNEFYYYDGGIFYPLPFKSYDEYISALIANAGVVYWQYFYIEPEEIIRKNKGLNYMTTDLRIRTRKVADISIYEYNPEYTFDRLDLIAEYLTQCIQFLPDAFPTMNFDHQKKYLQRLEIALKAE